MQVTNTAEGGTAAAVVTTANSGGTSGTAWTSVTSTSATVDFSSSAIWGNLSYRIATAATSVAATLIWDTTVLGSPTRVYGRTYIKIPTLGVDRELMRWRRGTTQIARLRLNGTSNFLELRQGGNQAPATSGGTGTVALVAGTVYRIEWDIQAGTLTNTIYLYLGDSTTPLETIAGNGIFSTTGAVNEIGFGQFTAATNITDMFFDDILVNDTGLPGPASHTVALSSAVGEGLTLAGAVARAAALPRAAGEGLTLAGAATGAVVLSRGAAQSLTVGDATARNYASLAAIAQSLGIADVPARITARSRSAAESVTQTDVTSRSVAAQPAVSNALTSSDVFGTVVSRGISLAQGLAVGNTAGRQVTAPRGLGESVAAASMVFPGTGVTVGFAEGLASADSWARATGWVRPAAGGTVSFDDEAQPVIAHGATVGEAMTAGDVQTISRVVFAGVAETVGLADSTVRAVMAVARAVSESVTAGQVMDRQVSRDRGVAEAVGAADVLTWVRQLVSSAASAEIAFSTAANAVIAAARAATNPVSLVDGSARAINRARSGLEVVTAVDLWQVARRQTVAAGAQLVLVDVIAPSSARTAHAATTVLIFDFSGAGDAGAPLIIAHTSRVVMSSDPRGRIRMTSPDGTVRRTI